MDIAHPQSLQTDPKIQNVRGYWAGSEDKGISQQTVIQNIFSKFLSKTTEIQKIHFAEETSFSTSFLSDPSMIIRPVHKNLFLEFPKYPGSFMLHVDR